MSSKQPYTYTLATEQYGEVCTPLRVRGEVEGGPRIATVNLKTQVDSLHKVAGVHVDWESTRHQPF